MTPNLERAKALFSGGLAAHGAGDWEGAERLYREALALAPGRPSLLFNLGRLLLDRERDAEAERLFGEVLQTTPHDHEAHCNLGICRARQGRFEEALASYDRAIALKQDFAEAHSNRGLALGKLARHEAALGSHARSVELAPESAAFQVRFARSATARALDERKLPAAALEPAVLACLAGRNVDYQALGRIAWAIVRGRFERSGLDVAHGVDFEQLHREKPQALQALCADPLLLRSLERIAIADRATEALFTDIRAALLRLIASDDAAPDLLATLAPLAIALAQQCFLNEYVWDVSEAEQSLAAGVERRIEAAIGSAAPSGAAVGIVACYRPLSANPLIAGWCRAAGRERSELAGLVTMQVIESATEVETAAGLRQIGGIGDRISLAVKAQYEENPYPRWLSVARDEPEPYTEQILRDIAPYSPALAPATDAPRILIAGCGTGRHAILYAASYAGAKVTAIDLSRASLAYASRKAAEMGAGNIEFLCADILDLDALGTKFDVISSIGVLHHMAEPAEGLRRLTERLAPGGYMTLGLYSELARRDIVELRALIAREGFPSTPEGIRACRRFVRDCPGDRYRPLVDEAVDFYSTSMVRDLLFHVMEHRFTIPKLAELLGENDLRFLGFTFADPAAKALYGRTYPADLDMLGLDNWAGLESTHPWIFRGMYQLWAARADVAA